MYAGFFYAVGYYGPTRRRDAQARHRDMYGQVLSAISFLQPEILAIGKDKLDEWMAAESEKLATYKHYFDDLFRKQAHVRSAEVEELLGLVTDPLQGRPIRAACLTNADFKFKPAKDSDGTCP